MRIIYEAKEEPQQYKSDNDEWLNETCIDRKTAEQRCRMIAPK